MNLVHEIKKGMIQGNQFSINMLEQRNQYIKDVENRGKSITSTVNNTINQTRTPTNLYEAFENNLVLAQLGCRVDVVSGLAGTVYVPKYSGNTVFWLEDNEYDYQNKENNGEIGEVSFNPKTLVTTIDISKTLQVQNDKFEAQITNALAKSISHEIEKTVFGNHLPVNFKPDGLYTGFTGSTVSGTITYEDLLEVENSLDFVTNKSAFITNRNGRKALRKVKVTDSQNSVYTDGKLIDYPVFVSSYMPSNLGINEDENGIIFANWADYQVILFGNLDITVNPVTKATEGKTQIIVTSFVDFKPIIDSSFIRFSLK